MTHPDLSTAMILAGGVGSRLRSVVSDRPKVLAAIHGRPFLTYLLDVLEDAGLRRVVLCTGYMAESVEAALGATYGAMRLVYSPETTLLGTGGAIRAALGMADSGSVLIMNGDSFCEADLPALADLHRQRQANATILLTEVPDTGRFGRVRIDDAGRLLEFEEKGLHAGPGWINAGIYLVERQLLESIPAGRAVSLERDVFPGWIGQGLYGYPVQGRFLDIGTPESFAAAEAFLAQAGKSRISPLIPLGDEAAITPCPSLVGVGDRRRFVVLDRDGTINIEREYLSSPDQVELLPRACEGLRALGDLGLGLIIVTNQSAVGRGYFDMARLEEIHRHLRALLARHGVELDGISRLPSPARRGLRLPQAAAGVIAPRGGRARLLSRRLFRRWRQTVRYRPGQGCGGDDDSRSHGLRGRVRGGRNRRARFYRRRPPGRGGVDRPAIRYVSVFRLTSSLILSGWKA